MSKKLFSFHLILLILLIFHGLPSASPLTLYDSKNYPYDIQDGGALNDGYSNAYDGCYYLYINDTVYTGTRSEVENEGRETICDVQSIAGLNISRKIFVPETENWARYLEILSNPTEDEIFVNVRISGDLGSNGDTLIISTSDGDSVFENTDRWLVTDDHSDGGDGPSLGHIFEGSGAQESVSAVFASNGNDEFYYGWDEVGIDPGQTKILMHFAVQQINRSQAISEANTINPPSLAITLSGLGESERSKIVNWDLGPKVTSAYPSHNAENINVNSHIYASFDKELNSSTVNNTTFLVSGSDSGDIAGAVHYYPEIMMAEFSPSSDFASGEIITVNLTTQIQDLQGKELFPTYQWAFVVGSLSDNTPPSPISDLSAADDSDRGIDLTWTPSGDADIAYYRIYRDTSAITDVTGLLPIGVCTESNYKDIPPNTGNEYYYAVAAVDQNGNENPYVSGYGPVNASNSLPPQPPSTISITVVDETTLTLSWAPNAEDDFAGYKIYYGNKSEMYNHTINVGNITSYTLNNLLSGITYYFALSAYDIQDNESIYSVEVLAMLLLNFRVTDDVNSSGQPAIGIDSQGNIHIAWIDNRDGNSELYYTMMDRDRNVRIEDTRVTFDEEDTKRPSIVIDSFDKVFIIFQDRRGENIEIYCMKLDPSLDNQDGDSADPATIKIIEDTIVSHDDGEDSRHPRMAIDDQNNIHIIWSEGEERILYKKIAADGSTLINETVVDTGGGYWRENPVINIDSNRNVHIAWNDNATTSAFEIYYKMLNGFTGSTLIDTTRITSNDGNKSKRQSLLIDSKDQVIVIWQDRRRSETELYFMKFDPSLDDQNGDMADINAMRIVADTALTPDDEEKSNQPFAIIDAFDNCHITWFEHWRQEGGMADDLHYLMADNQGNITRPDIYITEGSTAAPITDWALGQIAVNSLDGHVHIVWSDIRDENHEIYYSSFPPPYPQVTDKHPEDRAVDVPLNSHIFITFSTDMNMATLNETTFLVSGSGSGNITGTVHYYHKIMMAEFSPSFHFNTGETIVVDLTTEIKDLYGLGLLPGYQWTFTVGNDLDDISPLPISGLTASDDSDGGIDLTWAPNREADLAYYRIYRDTSAIDDITGLTPVGVSFQSHHKDIPPRIGIDYYYAATAVDQTGNENPSVSGYGPISATNTVQPEPPGNVSIPVIEGTTLELSWATNSEYDIAGYKIHYGYKRGIYNRTIDVGNITSYSLGDLYPGETYYITMSAYDTQKNESAYSDEIRAPIPVLNFRITDDAHNSDQPAIGIDSQGNIHIVWIDDRDGNNEIYYTMMDKERNVLIEDTRVTFDGEDTKRPSIVIDSLDKAFIIWQDRRGENIEVYCMKIDPSLDNQDGDSADSATIKIIDDTALTPDDGIGSRHPRMAIDDQNNIHIVWSEGGERILYKKIASDGSTLIKETAVNAGGGYWRENPVIGVDSNRNVHIAWNDGASTSAFEIYYKMVDGLTGSTLIETTRITSDDENNSKRQSLLIDSKDQVIIIWQDTRGSNTEVYFMKLDPRLDDQNGDMADINSIKIVEDTPITEDDGEKSNYPFATIGPFDNCHITWFEHWREDEMADDLHYMMVNNQGNINDSDISITEGSTAATTTDWTLGQVAVNGLDGHVHIVWCDIRDENYEIYYSSFPPPYPRVTGTRPDESAMDVSINSHIFVTFSKDMDDVSLNEKTFSVSGSNSGDITGSLHYYPEIMMAEFSPSSDFAPGEIITSNLTEEIQDTNGTGLFPRYQWTFTVGDDRDESPPSPISGLKASDDSDGGIDLTWSPNREDDIAYYKIYRDTSAIDDVTGLITIGVSFQSYHKDIPPHIGTDYHYAVVAVDQTGNENPSVSGYGPVNASNTVPPQPPRNISITVRDETTLRLSWIPNSEHDIAGYKIDYGLLGDIYRQSIDVGNITHYSLGDLFPGEIYYITVSAYDTHDNQNSRDVRAMIPPPNFRVTYDENISDQPTIGIDSRGSLHIAWVDNRDGNNEIYYTMVDKESNVLIDDTRMTFNREDSKRPSIVIDSHDKVFIIWQDRRSENIEVYFMKIDPSKDAQDGDSADPAAIKIIDDTIVSHDDGEGSRHPRMAKDREDNIHIVWSEGGERVLYKKIASDGSTLIDEKVVDTGGGYWRENPVIGVDSNRNVHIAWNDNATTAEFEIYYKMLDGLTGSTLIETTRITSDDEANSKWQNLVIDSQDQVIIIWQDMRENPRLFFMKLDPQMDDQDGDAADIESIKIIDDRPVREGDEEDDEDEENSSYPFATIDTFDNCHISWYENWSGRDNCNLRYMVVDNEGNERKPNIPLTEEETAATASNWTLGQISIDKISGDAYIVWCDIREGNLEIYYSSRAPFLQVRDTIPENSATDVPLNSHILVLLSKDIDADTLDETTFVVNGSVSGTMSGVINYNDQIYTAEFIPALPYISGETIAVTLTHGLRDTIGKGLPSDYVFSFTTGDSSDTTAPGQIADLSAHDTLYDNGGSIDLVWSASAAPDLAYYRIYRDTSSIIELTGMGPISLSIRPHYQDTSTTDGVNYYYAIVAVDQCGNYEDVVSSFGPVVSVDNIPPSRPLELRARPDDTSIHLDWEANSEPDLAGYKIYWGTNYRYVNGESPYTDWDLDYTYTLSGCLFTRIYVKVYTSYYYSNLFAEVIGYNESGGSWEILYSGSQTRHYQRVLIDQIYEMPLYSKIRLYLDDTYNYGTIHYEYDFSTGCMYSDSHLIGTGTDYELSGLSNCTDYYVSITAVDTGGNESEFSDEVSSNTFQSGPPSAPTGLAGTPGELSATLNWDENPECDILGYDIYRSPGCDETYDLIKSWIEETSYTDNNLVGGIEYCYYIRAIDIKYNDSEPSQSITIIPDDTTPPAIPARVQVSPGDSVIELSWRANIEPDLAGYRIHYGISSGNYTQSVEIVNNTTHQLEGLTNGTKYYIVITAYDQSGNESGYSSERSAVPDVLKPILLVDDDGSGTYQSQNYFIDALEANNREFNLWTVAEQGWSPPSVYLSSYNIVIWSTADDETTTLSSEDEASLEAYLESGGRLFVSSQFVAPDIGMTDLVGDYLHITHYQYIASYGRAIGISSDPISDGVNTDLSFPGRTYAYTITPDAEALALFHNEQGKPIALRYADPEVTQYRVVYFSFPFEALSTTEEAPNNQNRILGRVIEWLSRPIVVSTYPDDDSMDLPPDTDSLIFFSEDMDVATLISSTITVTGSLSGIHICAYTYESSLKRLRLDPGSDFVSGEQVTITLGTGVSDLHNDGLEADYTWSFTIGTEADITPPSKVTGLVAEPIIEDGSIILSWDNNVEPDVDLYKIYRDTLPIDNVNGLEPLATAYLNTYHDYTAIGGREYYYAVIALDIYDNEDRDVIGIGPITSINNPPAPPTGVIALSAENITVVDISWAENTESDIAGYKLYYGFSSGRYEPFIDVGNQTSYQLTETYCPPYYIAITAYDQAGNESAYSVEAKIRGGAGNNILILKDGGTEGDVRDILSHAGFNVTISNSFEYQWDGTNPPPDGFDVIILLDGISYGLSMPVDGQTILVDFVKNGGGLIVTEWITIEAANHTAMSDLILLSRYSGAIGSDTYTLLQDHPVAEGLPQSFITPAQGYSKCTLKAGATALIEGSDNAKAVAIKEYGNGRIVEFSSAGNYGGYRPFAHSAQMSQLLINAVKWAAKGVSVVSSIDPSKDSLDIPLNTNISIIFREEMDALTLTNSTITVAGSISGVHSGSITYFDSLKQLLFEPESGFTPAETVSVIIDDSASTISGDPLDCDYRWSFTIGDTSDNIPPSPISGLIALDVPNDEGGKIEVRWDPSNAQDLAYYKVYRDTSPITDVSQIAPIAFVSATIFIDENTVDETDYYYALSAVDICGNEDSSVSGVGPVASLDNFPPAAPYEVNVFLANDMTLELSWQPGTEPDLAGYRIHYGTTTEYDRIVDVGTLSSYQLGGLSENVHYYMAVTAYDISGNESVYSIQVSALSETVKDLLFIVDEGSSTYSSEPYFKAAFESNGLLYTTWNIHDQHISPSSEYLSRFSLIIWSTGDDNSSTLSSSEEHNLEEYLDQGGWLFLCSQFLPYTNGLSDFIRDYLHISSYQDSQTYTTISGVPSDSISDGLNINLDFPGRSYSYPITVDTQASSIFTNEHDAQMALKYAGDYRVVYFDFPFEAISAEDPAPNNQNTVMRRVINWLSAPVVISTIPAHNSIDIPTNMNIRVSFSEKMLPETITTTTFFAEGSISGSIEGKVNYFPFMKSALFEPSSAFLAEEMVTVTLTTGIEDVSGVGLSSDFIFSFMAGTISDDTPPSPIQNLIAFDTPDDTGGNISLTWDPSMAFDCAYYKIYRDTLAFFDISGLSPISMCEANSFEDATTIDGIDYYYGVTAIDTSGNEDTSVFSIGPVQSRDNIPPASPSALSANLINENSVALNWSANTEADFSGYKVYWGAISRKTSGESARTYGDLDNTYSSDGFLYTDIYIHAYSSDNNTLSVTVTAHNPATSIWETLYTGGGGSRLILDESYTIPLYSHVRVQVNDTQNNDQIYYIYSLSVGHNIYQHSQEVGAATSLQIDELDICRSYYFSVTATDSSGNESGFSKETMVATTQPGTPQPPSNVVATSGELSIDLSWQANPECDLTEYRIYRTQTSGSGYNLIGSVPSSTTVYQDRGLMEDTTYYYVVTAVDTLLSESGLSQEASAIPIDTTAPSIPIGLEVSFGEGVLDIFWSANTETDLSGYKLYYGSQSGNYSNVVGLEGQTSYQISGLDNGTRYYISLTAYDSSGNESGLASEVSAMPQIPQSLLFVADDKNASYQSEGYYINALEANQIAYNIWQASHQGGTPDAPFLRKYDIVIWSTADDTSTTLSDQDELNLQIFLINGGSLVLSGQFIPYDRGLTDFVRNYLHITDYQTEVSSATVTGVIQDPITDGMKISLAYPGAAYANSITPASDATGIFLNASSQAVALRYPAKGYNTYKIVFFSFPFEAISISAPAPNNQAAVMSRVISWISSPRVINTIPASDATGASINTNVAIIFSEDMDPFTLDSSGILIEGSASGAHDAEVQYYQQLNMALLDPIIDFIPGETATITVTTQVLDSGGMAMDGEYSYSFTTSDISDQEPPAPITGLSVSDVPADAGGIISLSWQAGVEAEILCYHVYRNIYPIENASPLTPIMLTFTDHCLDTSSIDGVRYYYAVTAVDACGNEDLEVIDAGPVSSKENIRPARPVDLDAQAGPSTINLSWSANTEHDLAGYRIYYRTEPGEYGEAIDVGNQTSYLVTGLEPCTIYYLAISAVDLSDNESYLSRSVNISTVQEGPPALPTGLLATAGDYFVSLQWSANSECDLAGYNLYRSTTKGGEYTRIRYLLKGDPFTNTEVQNGTTYYYVITAQDRNLNESGFSTEVSATPLNLIPPAEPTGFKGTSGSTTINLSWDRNSEYDLAGYKIYYRTHTGSYGDPIVLDKVSSYQLSGMVTCIRYHLYITAYDTAMNESPPSQEKVFFTTQEGPPAIPTELTATAGDSFVDLYWSDNRECDMEGYNIYRSITSGGGYSLIRSLHTQASYQDTGVSNHQIYYYLVTAQDVAGNESAYSLEVNATPLPETIPPAPVTDLTAARGDTIVTLSWSRSGEGDFSHYNIYRQESFFADVTGLSPIAMITDSRSTSYEERGLANGTDYWFAVTAVDHRENEDKAVESVSATPVDILRPSPVSSFSALSHVGMAILSWAENNDIDFSTYLIYQAQVPIHSVEGLTPTVEITEQSSTTLEITGLANEERYYFAIVVKDADNNMSQLRTASVIPRSPIPIITGPTDSSTPIILHSPQVTISGTGPAGSTIEVFVGGLSRGTTGPVGNDGEFHLADVVLNEGVNSITATATLEGSTSAPSLAISITYDVLPSIVIGLQATAGDTTITLQWQAVTDPDIAGYNIYRNGDARPLNGLSLTSTIFIDGSLTNGMTYRYRVRAVDTSGHEGLDSEEVGATPVAGPEWGGE
ncbi:MAG: Ig-like domain-containing protein [bacterium]